MNELYKKLKFAEKFLVFIVYFLSVCVIIKKEVCYERIGIIRLRFKKIFKEALGFRGTFEILETTMNISILLKTPLIQVVLIMNT